MNGEKCGPEWDRKNFAHVLQHRKKFSRGAFCWQILKFQTRAEPYRPQARDKISKTGRAPLQHPSQQDFSRRQ